MDDEMLGRIKRLQDVLWYICRTEAPLVVASSLSAVLIRGAISGGTKKESLIREIDGAWDYYSGVENG